MSFKFNLACPYCKHIMELTGFIWNYNNLKCDKCGKPLTDERGYALGKED